MDGGEPAGGRWNYDPENRKRLAQGASSARPDRLPARFRDARGHRPRGGGVPATISAISPASPWPVTRADALAALRHLLADALPTFGDYQDAMKTGAPFLYHALLSPAPQRGPAHRRGGVPGRRARLSRRRGAAPLRSRASSGRSSAGGNTCAASTGRGCRLPGHQRPRRGRATCRGSTGRGDGAELRRPGRRGDARPRLRAPHPAPDGDRELRPRRGPSTRRRSRNGT
ncbi:cryptochrome/photolyase family protein [Methylobacterium oryzae CBMB20]